MMSTLDTYKVDHLFLLIGSNPLPNYVAARLLAKDPETTTLWLIHSKGTILVRDTLERELKAEGFQHISAVLVDEASPTNIRNQVESTAKNLQGLIGLNYTGGTKAMSVHAYQALKKIVHLRVQYSYLDARTLTMQIEGINGISGTASIPVGHLLSLQVDNLFALHNRRRKSKNEFDRTLFWPHTAQALASVYKDRNQAEQWQAWLATTFFTEPDWPDSQVDGGSLSDEFWKTWVREQFVAREYKRRTWRKRKDHDSATFTMPELFQDVWTALRDDTGEGSLQTLGALRVSGKFDELEKLGKWLEGGWFESYVMQQVLHLRDQGTYQIHDITRNIHIKIDLMLGEKSLEQEIELDVVFTRGYQLFVLSCTTSEEKHLCKSKLIEAATRAEQVGGAEACVALICCSDAPHKLEKEIVDVLGRRVRVLGRASIPRLSDDLAEWIEEMSYSQEA